MTDTKYDSSKVSFKTVLISFRSGAYKKVNYTDWKHSTWIHLTRPDGTVVRLNPNNVNYMEDTAND